MSKAQALRVHDLDVAYRVRRRDLAVLRQVDFTIARGEAYGLVGESGCGKSTVALAIVRYLSANGRVTGGRIEVAGRDVLAMDPAELRRMRTTGNSPVCFNSIGGRYRIQGLPATLGDFKTLA